MENEQFSFLPSYPDAPEPPSLRFRPQKFFSGPLLLLFLGVSGGLLFAFVRLAPGAGASFPWIIVGCIAVFAALIAAIRYYTWVRQVPPIRFTREGLLLPRTARSAKTLFVPYGHISSIDLRSYGNTQALVIGTDKRHFLYPLDLLDATPVEVHASLEQAFLFSASANNQWPVLQQRQVLAADFMARPTRATWTLLALLAAVYLLQGAAGNPSDVFTLIAMGGNAPDLVSAGEWSRLFTANFLHANLLHIYFNGIAILTLGSILEKIAGPVHLTLVYLISCLAGTCTSYLFSDALVSVGASTGVFGLLGAYAVVNFTLGANLPAGFAQTRTWWLIILLLNTALPFFVPQIDWRAHAGGFAAGLIVMWLLLHVSRQQAASQPLIERIASWRKPGLSIRMLTLGIACLYVIAAIDIAMAWDDRQQSIDSVMSELVVRERMPPDIMNEIAWAIVEDENRSAEAVAMAEKGMKPIVDEILAGNNNFSDEKKAAFLDTWASLRFLNEHYDEAAQVEFHALLFSYSQFYASQFSLFVDAWNREQGVLVAGNINAADFSVDSEMTSEGRARVTVLRREGNNSPVVVVVHVKEDDLRRGFISCQLPGDSSMTVFDDSNFYGAGVEGLQFELAMLSTSHLQPGNEATCSTALVDGADYIQLPLLRNSP